MKQNIKLTKNEYKKEGTTWRLVRDSHKIINEEFYNNILDAKPFMRNLGGYERHIKTYTKYGRMVGRVISINPSRDYKSVYMFDFEDSTNA